MKKYFLIFIFLFAFSFISANSVFAAGPGFSNLVFDMGTRTFTGVLNNDGPGAGTNSPTSLDINIYNQGGGTLFERHAVQNLFWEKGPFSVPVVGNFNLTPNLNDVYISGSQTQYGSFIDPLETRDPPIIYDSIEMVADDANETRKDKIGFRIVQSNSSSGSSQQNNNQSQQSSSATVTVKESSITLNTDNPNNPYYNIKGRFSRSEDVDVYLVLKRSPFSGGQSTYTDLCHFQSGGGSQRSFYYGDQNDGSTRCPGHPKYIEAFSYAYSYDIYFATSSKGSPVSDLISLEAIPKPKLLDPLERFDIFKKKAGSKHYYSISGKVRETKAQDTLAFHVIALPSKKNAGVLATIPYKKGEINILENGIGNFSGLAPGKYLIQVRDKSGNLLQEKIPSELTDTDGTTSNDSQANGGTNPVNVKEGKLVSADCGYNLGPNQGGRMCGFNDLISLLERIIQYIFVLVLPIAAIVFAYAGVLYLTSGANPKNREAAKTAMVNLIIGIIVIMLAWLLVRTILVAIGAKAGFTMYLFN